MAIERDNLHFTFREVDGYNKDIVIVISAREGAKSTSFMLDKAYSKWKKTGATLLYLVMNAVEICDSLITSIQDNIINKFTDDNVHFEYKTNEMEKGVCDIKINGKLFMRILACNVKLRKIKQSLLKDINAIVFDEFIINPRKGEKYVKGLAFTISEIYTTYKRERQDKSKPLKMYFLGNPYSLYNPIFLWLGVDVNKLKLGDIYVGSNYVIQWYKLKQELRDKILAENPLYEFDEEYKAYAFDGKPVNDTNIKVGVQPLNYQLQFLFKHLNKYIGVFRNNYYEDGEDRYYCTILDKDKISNQRTAYCFDFAELVNRCALLSKEDRAQFYLFKNAMRKRKVVYSSIDCYYLVEEIYFNL